MITFSNDQLSSSTCIYASWIWQNLKLSICTVYIYLHKLLQLLSSLQIIAKTNIAHNLVAYVCEMGIKSGFPFPIFEVVVFYKIYIEYLIHLTKVGQDSCVVVMGTIISVMGTIICR